MTKGIMFDMDNTVLYSNIDFKEMRQQLIEYFMHEHGLTAKLFEELTTPAEVIEEGKQALLDKLIPQTEVHNTVWEEDETLAAINKSIWSLVQRVETVGMKGAKLAPNASETLQWLKQKGYTLAIVTNNAYESARLALEETEVLQMFDLLVSRDQMEALKPAPSGLIYAKNKLNRVEEWLMVGDSWIDGRAAQLAEIPFIAYQAEQGTMQSKQVQVLAYLNTFNELREWIDKNY